MSSADALETRPLRSPPKFIVDLSQVDMDQAMVSRAALEERIPHRGVMSLLDGVIWHDEGYKQGIAIKRVQNDEFWVPGHFPGRPMMPGVMMIEAGAQLASFLFHCRRNDDCIAGFTRIENAVFRGQVLPGQELIVLAREVKYQPRRFISDIQGIVADRLVFEARITGMVI